MGQRPGAGPPEVPGDGGAMTRRSLLALPVLLALAGCASSPIPARAAATSVLLIGDSITRQADMDAFAAAAGVPLSALYNAGANGTTTRDWLPGHPYLTQALAAAQARGITDVAILSLGTNDAKGTPGLGFSALEVRNNLAAIATGLRQAGYRWVLLSAAPYVVPGSGGGAWDALSPTRIASYNARLDEAAAMVGAGGVSVGEREAFDFFYSHPERLADGVHPDAAGQWWLSDRRGQAVRWAGGGEAIVPEGESALLILFFFAFLAGGLYRRRVWEV